MEINSNGNEKLQLYHICLKIRFKVGKTGSTLVWFPWTKKMCHYPSSSIRRMTRTLGYSRIQQPGIDEQWIENRFKHDQCSNPSYITLFLLILTAQPWAELGSCSTLGLFFLSLTRLKFLLARMTQLMMQNIHVLKILWIFYFTHGKKTIEFNCEKKAVVNTNIISSFIIFMPIHIGKKVRLLRHQRFHNSYNWWCNRGFHNGYKWYGAIRGLNSSCVVVVSCRLMKWFCVLKSSVNQQEVLAGQILEGTCSGVFLKACTKTENSHVKD